MATWYTMCCDWNESWRIFSDTDIEPTEEQLVCPDGHPAITLERLQLHEFVRITLAAAGPAPDSQSSARTRFFLELSTWDGKHRLLSAKTYTWTEAVQRAEYFHNLSWEAAERRWLRLRM